MTTVAIDGPAGSGKSSVARIAAQRLGFHLLDTGAAYRSLAWLVLERGLDPYVEADVLSLLDEFDYAVDVSGETQRFSVGGVDVTDAIRTERISGAVSGVARVPAVREAVNVRFRGLIADAAPGIVVEGRDITTVVAPDADVRILLTADEDVRIRRRIGDELARPRDGHLDEERRDRREDHHRQQNDRIRTAVPIIAPRWSPKSSRRS